MEIKKELYVSSIPIFLNRFETGATGLDKIPNDFEKLKSDAEFMNWLTHVTAEQFNHNEYQRFFIDEMEILENILIEEINKLQKI